MLFSYLCSTGARLHREAYPNGAQTKDADVFKWITMFSGSPAVCQREHAASHDWLPNAAGDEERLVRGYAVLQWDTTGFDARGKTKPIRGEVFDSEWGPALVAERTDDPAAGTYLLLRIYPHGHHGKPGELGTARTDVPHELAGKV